VAIPDDHLVGPRRQEPADGGIHLSGQELLQLGIRGLDLLLTADPGDPLGVGDDEDGLLRRSRQRGQREECGEEK
jgi:hypothetical protein